MSLLRKVLFSITFNYAIFVSLAYDTKINVIVIPKPKALQNSTLKQSRFVYF